MRMLGLFPFIFVFVEASDYFDISRIIKLRPLDSINKSDFGFSMAYQPSEPSSLIVGAPHETTQGEVYRCLLPEDDMTHPLELQCDKIPIKINGLMGTANVSRNLYLGASVSATSNFFLTCAPHWADSDTRPPIGTCVTFDKTVRRVKGLYEKFFLTNADDTVKLSWLGGFGWSLFTDNNMTIIPKSTPVLGSIMTLNNTFDEITQQEITVMQYFERKRFNKKLNIGYAIAAGNFFSIRTRHYAITETQDNVMGQISFMYYRGNNLEPHFEKYQLSDNSVGSMYGAALYSDDLNGDGLADLLMGAPTHAIDNGYENGAVHIFLGGPLIDISNKKRVWSIHCGIDGARFGSAILTMDLDHDAYPELIISAPYQAIYPDFGDSVSSGVVYIIAGSEINKLITSKSRREVDLHHFHSVQEIKNTEYKAFGYSLQVIPDMDGDGCDELAAGSPGSGTVILLPCIPRVNLTITAELQGTKDFVSDTEHSFTVKVCLHLSDDFNPQPKDLEFTVANSIIPNAHIDRSNASFTKPVSFRSKLTVCEPVLIHLVYYDPGRLTFTTEVKIREIGVVNEDKVNKIRRVALSLSSKTKARLNIERRCDGEDCLPRFKVNLLWSSSTPYVLGKTRQEYLTIQIYNEGYSAYDACAKVVADGTQVSRIRCPKEEREYICYLESPMKPFDKTSINVYLNMTSLNNFNESLRASVSVYKSCKSNNYTTATLNVPLTLDTSQIILKGDTQHLALSQKDKESNQTVSIVHVITVYNNGFITWKNLVLSFDIKSFNLSFVSKVSLDCGVDPVDLFKSHGCVLKDLYENSRRSIHLYIELNKYQLRSLFENTDRILTMESKMILSLKPTEILKELRLLSQITLLHEELEFGQNEVLVICISVVAAVIGLSIIILILFKLKFFKRKEKEKLEDLKDKIRSGSIVQEILENNTELQDLRKRRTSNLGGISEENLVDAV